MNALETTFAQLEQRMSRAADTAPARPAPAALPESKGDATTRAARAILEAESQARTAKVAALRAARLNRPED